MIDIHQAIKVERRRYKSGNSTLIYFFLCACGRELKVEKKNLHTATGKCRVCAHCGVPYLSTYNDLKDSVIRTNIKRKRIREFDLSFDEFLEFTKINSCEYCSTPIEWHKHVGNGRFRYNLDRKDNTRGYLKDNLVVCCKQCNMMKRDFYTHEEFKYVMTALLAFRKQ